MNDTFVSKWNARYARAESCVPPPADVLVLGERWLPGPHAAVSPDSAATLKLHSNNGFHDDSALTALDLACGLGGNAHWLAEKGFRVSAWDISDVAIADLKARRPQLLRDIQVRDVVAMPPDAESFDVIVVTRFLEKALCPALTAALKPGGVLFYQTFTHGLSNPDFLLGPDELPGLFAGLKILDYHEPEPDEQGRAEARMVARKD